MAYLSIHSELKRDSSGKIKRLSGLNSKKDWINLYMSVISGEVPFSSFGQRFILSLFQSMEESEILELINDLVLNIRQKFLLNVNDYTAELSDSNFKLNLFLSSGETVDFSIGDVY